MKWLGRECSRLQLKGFLSACGAHSRCLRSGGTSPRLPARTSRGPFTSDWIRFVSLRGSACPNSNDDENEQVGPPRERIREEGHHCSEGDMGGKPWVPEGSVSQSALQGPVRVTSVSTLSSSIHPRGLRLVVSGPNLAPR